MIRIAKLLPTVAVAAGILSSAQAQSVTVYQDQLENGFNNWSWNCTVDLASTTYVHTGTASIGITYTGGYQGFYLETAPFILDTFSSLQFYINGGTASGRTINVAAVVNNASVVSLNLNSYVAGGQVLANTWKLVSIPISALGVTAGTRIDGFWLQEASGSAQPEFWVDDIGWAAAPVPSGVIIRATSALPIRTVDLRHFGVNADLWDNIFDTATTKARLSEAGYRMFRYPGGSLSDSYHWATNRADGNSYDWPVDFDQFHDAASTVSGQSFITTNYGSGTAAEAAAWVADSKSKGYGYKYWEVGNEVYGTWENDTHPRPNDPFTYAQQFSQYAKQMRAADGTVKVGAVAAAGEDTYVNYTDHTVTNPVTGVKHNGWTPVMLAYMLKAGVLPDFIVYHRYPEQGGDECDFWLLQSGYTWATDIASLRMMLNDYLGTAKASKIEIVCDENNTGGGGKQEVSIVNGLYLADSYGNVLNTECNSYVWWDIYNGQDTSGNYGSWIYGWRMYEDEGQLDSNGNPYPMFYVQKLLSKYAAPGDKVITCKSSNLLVASFAVQRADGSVALMVINKHPSDTIPVQFQIDAPVNRSSATSWYYGEAQDTATKNGGSAASQDIQAQTLTKLTAGSWFDVPPYSVNIYIFSKI